MYCPNVRLYCTEELATLEVYLFTLNSCCWLYVLLLTFTLAENVEFPLALGACDHTTLKSLVAPVRRALWISSLDLFLLKASDRLPEY
ncbi:hypothetical protein D3C87_1896490 [compost metagenome]